MIDSIIYNMSDTRSVGSGRSSVASMVSTMTVMSVTVDRRSSVNTADYDRLLGIDPGKTLDRSRSLSVARKPMTHETRKLSVMPPRYPSARLPAQTAHTSRTAHTSHNAHTVHTSRTAHNAHKTQNIQTVNSQVTTERGRSGYERHKEDTTKPATVVPKETIKPKSKKKKYVTTSSMHKDPPKTLNELVQRDRQNPPPNPTPTRSVSKTQQVLSQVTSNAASLFTSSGVEYKQEDVAELLKGYVLVNKADYRNIPYGSHVRYLKHNPDGKLTFGKSAFITAPYTVAKTGKEYMGMRVNPKGTKFSVLLDNLHTVWKKIDRDSNIELRMVGNSLEKMNARISKLETAILGIQEYLRGMQKTDKLKLKE